MQDAIDFIPLHSPQGWCWWQGVGHGNWIQWEVICDWGDEIIPSLWGMGTQFWMLQEENVREHGSDWDIFLVFGAMGVRLVHWGRDAYENIALEEVRAGDWQYWNTIWRYVYPMEWIHAYETPEVALGD